MTHSQSTKPTVNATKTVALYDAISSKTMEGAGSVQLREHGILLHPGEREVTQVVFDVSKLGGFITIAAWISAIPQEALANEQAGVAGLQLFLDQKPIPRFLVDRHTNVLVAVDLTGVSELRLVADNGNDTSLYDWLFVAVL